MKTQDKPPSQPTLMDYCLCSMQLILPNLYENMWSRQAGMTAVVGGERGATPAARRQPSTKASFTKNNLVFWPWSSLSFQVETKIEQLPDIMISVSVAQGKLPHYAIIGCLYQAAQTGIT